MARRKIKIEYIENQSVRKATHRKRSKGLLKKVREISILCGIEVCAILYSPFDRKPVVWPSTMDAQRTIAKFRGLPEEEQARRMFDPQSSIAERLDKSRVIIETLERNNKEKNMELLMYQCMAGLKSLHDVPLNELVEMRRLVDRKMADMAARMQDLGL